MVIGIDRQTRERLWSDHVVAVHVPDDPDGNVPAGPDNVSLNLDDHDSGGRRRLKALLTLAANGGYVYPEYRLSETAVRYLVGKVRPGSTIERHTGTWGGRYEQGNRPATLLFVRLVGVQLNPPHFRGAPPHTTLSKWPSVGSDVADLF